MHTPFIARNAGVGFWFPACAGMTVIVKDDGVKNGNNE